MEKIKKAPCTQPKPVAKKQATLEQLVERGMQKAIKEYGEVGSLSNCTDFQARDLNIKLLTKKGEKLVMHTLNNTAIATSRALVVIMENYQQKDGTVKVPAVLVPYMNGKKVLGGKIKAK